MVDRRRFLRSVSAGALGLGVAGAVSGASRGGGAAVETVRDRIWLWGHAAGSHTKSVEQWGLAGKSTIEPVDAARYLGIGNVIMVRYDGVPAPPLGPYAQPFRDLEQVVWSIEGGGGDDVDAVLGLRDTLPNLRGIMMDDYFGRVPRPSMWLAANNPAFPVHLTMSVPRPLPLDRIKLTQSDWPTGDYRTAAIAVDLRVAADAPWQEVALGTLPNEAGRSITLGLPGDRASAVRVRVLGTHDTEGAVSCGLTRVVLSAGGRDVSELVTAAADSEYDGHPAGNVVSAADVAVESTFTLRALQGLRARLDTYSPPLDLWVVLYTHELGLGSLREHLDLCDVIALWTWRAEDLPQLESNMDRLDTVIGDKRKSLGLYMWDYGVLQPMPISAMEHQCDLALRWLREGRIESMIFLASCICDLDIEAVEWTRQWIAAYGDAPL